MSSQGKVEWNRFRKNEECIESGCRSKKWRIEDGRKFCGQGHEQIGWSQIQQDEDDFGNDGKKTKKQRDDKGRETNILSGREAQELFVHCYQLILWKQCYWLVKAKGFPLELETVIRDLWMLRLRVFEAESKRDGYDSGFSSSAFSGSDSESASDATAGRSLRSGTSSRSLAEKKRELPKLVDTLALCYLGTLLMRLPTSLGDIFRWASKGEMVFTTAVSNMRTFGSSKVLTGNR